MPTFRSAGKDIQLDAHLPAAPGPHPAILLLHGSGGNISFWLDRLAPALTHASLPIALFAVHYFDRTHTTRATPADLQDGIHVPQWLETVRDALTHIAANSAIDPQRIALVGISLGAFLSLALAAGPAPDRNATPTPPIRALVEISGGLVSPYAERATPAFPPTLILHGEADNVVPVTFAQALDTLLTRLHVSHQTLLLPAEGHWFSPTAQLRILAATAAFLRTHL